MYFGLLHRASLERGHLNRISSRALDLLDFDRWRKQDSTTGPAVSWDRYASPLLKLLEFPHYGSDRSDQTESDEFGSVLFARTADAKLLGTEVFGQ